MSLINDALKRASAATRRQDPPSSSGLEPMQPVPAPAAGPARQLNVVALLLGAVICLAGVFFFLWWNSRHSVAPEARGLAPAPSGEAAATVAAKAPAVGAVPEAAVDSGRPRILINTNLVIRELPAPEPAVPSAIAATPNPVPPASSTSTPVPVAPTTPVPPAAVVPPTVLPELKLQAIFYRLKKPEAVLNGRTVGVGDSVSGAKVTRIDRREISVEWNGQIHVISME